MKRSILKSLVVSLGVAGGLMLQGCNLLPNIGGIFSAFIPGGGN